MAKIEMEPIPCHQETDRMVEIIKNQLYFAVIKGLSGKKVKNTNDAIYFSIDDEFEYQNYYYDFGPYHLSYLYKYCCRLNKYLHLAKGTKKVIHCASTKPEKKVNAAFLIGSYSIIYLNIDPVSVIKILNKVGPFKQFMDASQIPCRYTISIDYFFYAIGKARALNFFDFEDFDVNEYDMYEKMQYGDMNWLVPRKFLAFIGPNTNEILTGHPPQYYLKYFLKNDIRTVIRLNNKMYDSIVFSNAGIEHFDLIYADGTTPSRDILLKFLYIVETAPSAIAVHCKAGLGRTGSLIGAYIIKHYNMTAKEAIAWMRICRPGSVIGQQQMWLEKIEKWLWKCGNNYRDKHYGMSDKIPRHKFGIYSKTWLVERNRAIREQKRKCFAQGTTSDTEYLRNRRYAVTSNKQTRQVYHRSKKKNIVENSCFDDISQFLKTVYGFDKGTSVHKTMPNIKVLTAEPQYNDQYARDKSSNEFLKNFEKQNHWYRSNHNPSVFNSFELHGDHSKPISFANFFHSNSDTKTSKINKKLSDFISKPKVVNVDKQTDTSGYVPSYMEELKNRKKKYVVSARTTRILTQGDRLNEIKINKKKKTDYDNHT